MKNITLSAEEQLIDRARKKANHNGTTLNVEFRRWLEHYTGAEAAHHRYEELMERQGAFADLVELQQSVAEIIAVPE